MSQAFGNRQRLTIALSYWSATFCEGAAAIILPLYFSAQGIKASVIGVMFFTYELFSLLMNFFSGWLINRVGYKAAVLLSLTGHTLASLGYLAVSKDLGTMGVLVLVNLLRALRGTGKELILTTSSAWLKQDTERRSRFLAVQFLLGGREGVKGAGLLTGGLLLTAFGFREAFMVLALITFLCIPGCLFILPDFREEVRVPARDFFLVRRKLHKLAVVRALLYSGRDMWLVIAVPVYLQAIGIRSAVISTVLASGFMIFGAAQVFGTWVMRGRVGFRQRQFKGKIRFRDSISSSHALAALVPLGIFFIDKTNIYQFAALVFTYNFMAGISTTAHNHLHIKYSRRRRSSVDVAYYKTIAQMGKVFAVLSSGIIYQYGGIRACCLAGAALVLLSALNGLGLRKMVRPDEGMGNDPLPAAGETGSPDGSGKQNAL